MSLPVPARSYLRRSFQHEKSRSFVFIHIAGCTFIFEEQKTGDRSQNVWARLPVLASDFRHRTSDLRLFPRHLTPGT